MYKENMNLEDNLNRLSKILTSLVDWHYMEYIYIDNNTIFDNLDLKNLTKNKVIIKTDKQKQLHMIDLYSENEKDTIINDTHPVDLIIMGDSSNYEDTITDMIDKHTLITKVNTNIIYIQDSLNEKRLIIIGDLVIKLEGTGVNTKVMNNFVNT
ncbi:MAG: hypothetical protein E7Z84_06710 [Methanosphaera stadtmanae]|nr:hypothetical protein [Methanosphaera stadtmanae]